MVSLAATFGRGAMTNHWRDIRHADLILVNGANPAEAHPVGFRWLMKAKTDRGAKIIHADPRFTRTSAVADMHLRIRTGTDVAYFGGLINYVLENNLYHKEYVEYATNAGFVVSADYKFEDGMFNGFNQQTGNYNATAWTYETEADTPDSPAKVDIAHPRSVLNLLREHYKRYTPEMVERITGIPRAQFLEVARQVGEMGRPDKVMTVVYAVGLTHHTTGVQLIRSAAVLQLLLGNMGRPGGGMNAERGHANIQGNTDHAISWDILPGYMRIPAPGQTNLTDYVAQSASKKARPNSVNFFGENYRKFTVSLLKAWYGDAATKDNEFAFHHLPKPAANASWISIFDQALRGKMEGVILSGMTATSIGPDSNQVLQALSNLKWLCVMDPFRTTSSEFWNAPGMDPAQIQTEVFMLPATHWIEKDGSFTNSGRWVQWKDQVIPPEGEARHDHWILADVFGRVRELYRQQGGKYPDPVLQLTLPYRDPRKPELDEIAQEINGKNLTTGKRLSTFAELLDDGTTSAGDWIYTGHYPESGNLAKRRDGVQDPAKNDPTGMGFYPNWAWAWPLNRRVLYNRASADTQGRPWDPTRPGIAWDGAKWAGDVPDYPPTAAPGPNAPLPFIMTGEGTGRLFSNGVADGPFPEHYEPIESPVENPLHPRVSVTPAAFLYDQKAGRPNRFGTAADYPYVATSYRLTEHEHYVTQNIEHLVQLQPEAFVEVPAELAAEKGIKTGDHVRVSSKRGKLEVRAVVTKRLGPLQIDGKKVYQIGIPIHWGFVGINEGQHWLANALTPFVGDASARTPEFKAFLVNIEKMT
ncbi:formate dehydrogenase-N subunit alpha [Kibdelosporangium aridum]|uniref:Formate dehydrogenase-N subunit alpha n=1 Tax=Kibdelosporangium aridum TaxID=2030 RepID=A0A428ZEA7_KIBAR|nr:formate dehydrogenase-N subunit alpha [Kibdelosporangium aridum]RSM86300.1 formate dehydrogenase-N subunit alpha [Kibdelosporangium aridum]